MLESLNKVAGLQAHLLDSADNDGHLDVSKGGRLDVSRAGPSNCKQIQRHLINQTNNSRSFNPNLSGLFMGSF